MNNRQANGRRRGRGGQQRQGGNPNQRDNGNRIDNRARGNAAQLLEKYKNLARDAQMQGDRVNTEYYLQFADHYFRVLSETRSRFEEQNQRQQRVDQDGDDEEFGFEGEQVERDEPYHQAPRQDREPRQPRAEREPREAREPRQDREGREPRQPREPRQDRRNGRANGEVREQASEQLDLVNEQVAEQAEVQEAPAVEAPKRRARAPRREVAPVAQGETQGIDAAVLPPAFGLETVANDDAEVEAEAKPRRRRVRKDAEVPPAA